MNTQSKREKEKLIVGEMIKLYCKKNHGTENGLCKDCQQLKDYAEMRSEKCPFTENKTFCSNCRVHCYKPEMREKIQKVMRFAGPRMIFYHPVMAINHIVQSEKEKRKREAEK